MYRFANFVCGWLRSTLRHDCFNCWLEVARLLTAYWRFYLKLIWAIVWPKVVDLNFLIGSLSSYSFFTFSISCLFTIKWRIEHKKTLTTCAIMRFYSQVLSTSESGQSSDLSSYLEVSWKIEAIKRRPRIIHRQIV